GAGRALVDAVPVDGVPPGGHVVGTPVLVLQVVGVLPDVDPENGYSAFHDGVVLVGEALHRQPAAGQVGPAPAAPELPDAGLAGRVLVGGEVPECLADGVRDRARRVPAPARAHDGPEDRVVEMPAAVVANDGPDVLGHRRQ